ncbi:MAG: TolC family protein [Candidatus Omnitrophica bacterium]|nr:TolC family protein [Candidatus Omnitrophota bacterium]
MEKITSKHRMSLLILAILFFFRGFLYAEEKTVYLTLDEAITIALRDNADILLSKEQLEKAKAQIKEAKANLYPGVVLVSSFSDTRGLFNKDRSAISGNVSIKQLLYKGGQVISAIKIGQYYYEAEKAALDNKQLEIIFSVKNAYYNLLLAKHYSNLNRQILENSQRHFETMEKRYAYGEVSDVALQQMKANLAQVKAAYEESLNQVKTAQAAMNVLLSLKEEITVEAVGEFNYEKRDIALDMALLEALKEHPALKQLDAQVDIANQNVEIAKAQSRPTVLAGWDYYASNRLSTTGIRNQNDYNVLAITVSWPVFDGWLTKAKIEQAIAEVKKANLTQDKTKKALVFDIKQAYFALQTSLNKLSSAEEELKTYEDALISSEQKYRKGIISSLDLEDAKLRVAIARFNKAMADYEYLVARAKFDKATGGRIQ